MKLSYNNIKFGFYWLGFLISMGFLIKDGLMLNSHTPSFGFISPIFFILIGFVWSIIDLIIAGVFDRIRINYQSHIFGISLYGLIIIGMFVYMFTS